MARHGASHAASAARCAVHVELTNAGCERDCARRRKAQTTPTNWLLAQFDRASNQLVRSGRIRARRRQSAQNIGSEENRYNSSDHTHLGVDPVTSKRENSVRTGISKRVQRGKKKKKALHVPGDVYVVIQGSSAGCAT